VRASWFDIQEITHGGIVEVWKEPDFKDVFRYFALFVLYQLAFNGSYSLNQL
jgi:hypothetical protein